MAPTAVQMITGYQQMVASQPTQYLNHFTQHMQAFGGGNQVNPPPPSYHELM